MRNGPFPVQARKRHPRDSNTRAKQENKPMKCYIQVLLALSVELASLTHVQGAGAGGMVVGAAATNGQMSLLFETTSGYSYQVQAQAGIGSRFWSDTLPLVSATGSLTSVLAPGQGTKGFYRVLEFTNATFWYDWNYYYETPFLSNWGLGAVQGSYAHTDRAYDWFIDQADTGPCADNNCGPSSVTMGIKWYEQGFTNTAEEARNTYYEGGGWWYTSDVINYLNLFSIPNTTSSFTGTNQLMGLLSQGNLVILCIDTAYLAEDFTSAHRVGRFYSYASGHFIVAKGYRVVDSMTYFEVYDPNTWHEAYSDKTPMGRNRHYAGGDLANAIADWWDYLIVIPPPGGGGGPAGASVWLKPVDPALIVPAWGR